MTTGTYITASDNTNGITAMNWSYGLITNFMRSSGWTQTADLGQVVWPVSAVTLTNAVGNGSVTTFTYTVGQGINLAMGMSIRITGYVTNPTWNTTFVIQSIPTSTTFTVNSAVNATETQAGATFGSVNTQIAITNAVGNGQTNTYTYINTYGTLQAGQAVVITGCTTANFNGTFNVASINTGAGTFTTTPGNGFTHASEAETGTGMITSLLIVSNGNRQSSGTLPTSPSVFTVYEVWKSTDALSSSFPIYFKVTYTTQNATGSGPQIYYGTGHATDGAGNILGSQASSGAWEDFGGSATQSTNGQTSYFSVDTNRLQIRLLIGNGNKGSLMSIERSHDSSGNDTSEYVTYICIGGQSGAAPQFVQSSFNLISGTGSEAKLAAITNHSTGTGAYNGSTLLSPVFPLIGAVGNPMYNMLVGKSTDWLDQTTFLFTMYNTQRKYLIDNTSLVNVAGNVTNDASVTAMVAYRFE